MTEDDLANYRRWDVATPVDAHENGFYFDESDSVIYVSCKNISQILKIQYPSGKVLRYYGRINAADELHGQGLFCKQHSCRAGRNGHLYVYNNNTCNPHSMPRIVEMEEASDGSGLLKKVWEYDCSAVFEQEVSETPNFGRGGSVSELSDGSYFVTMSGLFGRIFIVNRQKQLLWCGISEKFDDMQKTWKTNSNYRGSFIEDKKALEHLVWGENIDR
jgi:hypothetical protein